MPNAFGTDIEIAYLFRIDVLGEIHGQLTQNSFHFSAYGSMLAQPPISIGSSLLSHFNTAIIPAWRQMVSQEWSVKTLEVHSMIPKSLVLMELAYNEGGGFQGDDSLPSFCAYKLRLRTGRGGGSGSGSLSIAGVPEGSSQASRLEGSLFGDIRQFGSILLAAYGVEGSSGSFMWGLYSRKLGDTRLVGPPVSISHSLSGFFPIINVIVAQEVATQKKRELHRGQ